MDKREVYRAVLSAAQDKLGVEINRIRSSIPHSGEIGGLIERQIRSSLEEVLPKKIGISNGFVVDSEGRISKQMDIVLYDKFNTPLIFASGQGQPQIFPVEATYACGEIKTRLDAKTLEDVFQKSSSYKNCIRKAYFESKEVLQKSYSLFGKKHKHWQSIFFCIAFESVNAQTLLNSYLNIANANFKTCLNIEKRLDTVIALNGPCLINCDPPPINGIPQNNSIHFLPSPNSIVGAYEAKAPWAFFIHLLLHYMVQVPTEPLNMLSYDNGYPF